MLFHSCLRFGPARGLPATLLRSQSVAGGHRLQRTFPVRPPPAGRCRGDQLAAEPSSYEATRPLSASAEPMNETGDTGSVPPGQRSVRRTSAPAISVVVASLRERKFLERCLDSLLPQCAEVNAEVVVARKGPTHELEGLRRGYPWVTLVAGPWGAGTAELRATGMAAATGDVVAIIEDDRKVEPNFMRQLTGLTTTSPETRKGTRGQGGA